VALPVGGDAVDAEFNRIAKRIYTPESFDGSVEEGIEEAVRLLPLSEVIMSELLAICMFMLMNQTVPLSESNISSR
jgi:hypothetical protein